MNMNNPLDDGNTYTYRYLDDLNTQIGRTDQDGNVNSIPKDINNIDYRRFLQDGGVCEDYVPPSE